MVSKVANNVLDSKVNEVKGTSWFLTAYSNPQGDALCTNGLAKKGFTDIVLLGDGILVKPPPGARLEEDGGCHYCYLNGSKTPDFVQYPASTPGLAPFISFYQ